jgi:hypothetical protein
MSAPANNEAELNELLTTFIDDELSTDQKRRLADLIKDDPAARARYLEHCRMHAALSWEHGVLDSMSFPAPENVIEVRSFSRFAKPLAIAAAIVVVLSLIWQSAVSSMQRHAWMAGPTIGSVERSSGGELAVRNLEIKLSSGEALRTGEYELNSGLVNLRFTNGVEVVVESPARFSLESSQLLILHAGRLSANVSPAGKGFTVQTPSADVIDHGTEFGVEVTAGLGSEIHVFRGEVEVKSRTADEDTLRLFTDQATRVDEVAGSPAGIAVDPDRFLRSFDEPSANYAARVRQLNPVLYFRMPPSSDGRTLTDQSGNGLHARIEAGTSERPLFASGRVGSAFQLGGPRVSTHAVVPDYPKTTNNQLSAVAWVFADSRPRWASIIKNWGQGEIGQFHFGLVDHTGELEILVKSPKGAGARARVRDTEPFPVGTWQHVAFVADGSTLRLYRNGQEIGSAPHKPIATPTIQSLGIGAKLVGNHPKRPGSPADFWHGRIDELALFNHALDGEAVRDLFATGNGPERFAASGR